MRNYIFSSAILALFLAFAPPVAAAEDDTTAFNAAYRVYQAAIESEDAAAAVKAASEVLELAKSIFPDDSFEMAALYIRFGSAQQNARQHKEAIVSLTEGLRRFEALYGLDDEGLIAPLRLLAKSAQHTYFGEEKRAKNIQRAKKIQRRALKLVAAIHGKGSELFADLSMEMGEILYFANSRNSKRYFQEAYDIYSQYSEVPNLKTGNAAFWLGKAAEQRRSRGQAEERYLEALQIFDDTVSPGHDFQLLAHTYLIKLYEDQGRSDEATLHCQAISLLRPYAVVDGYKPLYKRMPIYPPTALRAGRSGFVLVDFSVTRSGTVSNASIVESKGGRVFERAALQAVEGFRYAPAVKDGELVETTDVRNWIAFEIAN